MKKVQKAIKLFISTSLIFWALFPPVISAEEWGTQYIDSVSLGGSIEGNSKDMYFGFTRYKPGWIGIGAEASVYRYEQNMSTHDYSSTYTERDLSLTLPISATEKIYITPALGVRQIKNTYEIKQTETNNIEYEALYGLGVSF